MKKQRKRVLSLVLSYKLGGTAINSLRFIKNTKDVFDHYSIAHLVETDKDMELRNEYENCTKGSYDVDTTRFKICSLFKILSIAYEISPNIIHVNGKGGALYGFFLRLLYWHKHKLFYTMRGFHIKYTGITNYFHLTFEFIFNLLVTRAIAVSDSERSFYLKKTKSCAKKTIVIPNGINVGHTPLPEEIAKTIEKYELNIVSLSRTDPQKDLVTMLTAFEKIPENIALHIIGGYVHDSVPHISYRKEIENLLSELKCKNRVFLWGDINNAGNLIRYFDIYWSTAIFEGLPTAIVEAMMSKVLVVGTNCRGNIDLIRHSETGFLSKMEDAIDCANVLLEAIACIKSRNTSAIIDVAYKESKNYSIDNNVKALTEIYLGE